jgi:hypothetical protein
MSHYLVAIHLPDDFDPATHSTPEMERDIDALNAEMVAAGIRIFVGGLTPARKARSLRKATSGKIIITDGPFLESKEHVGGFWVLDCPTEAEALEWARKAVIACRAPVEVRAFW